MHDGFTYGYYGIITEGKFCLFCDGDATHEISLTRYAKHKGIPDMRTQLRRVIALQLDTGFVLDSESVEDYLHDERTFHAFPIKPCLMYAV